MNLTITQKKYYLFIAEFIESNGYSPTVAEIAEHFGVTTNAVWMAIQILKRKNIISTAHGRARTIRLVKGVGHG